MIRPCGLLRSVFAQVALLAAALLTCSAHAEEWKTIRERWYAMELESAPFGWLSETVEESEGQYRTSTETQMVLVRADATVQIQLRSAFVETKAGEPVSLHFHQVMSTSAVETTWAWEDEKVVRTTRGSDRELRDELPAPQGEWLTPMEVHRFVKERRSAGAKEISYRAIDPQAGIDPIGYSSTLESSGTVTHDGREIPVTIWKSTSETMPGMPSRDTISSDGELLSSVAKLHVGEVTTRLTTKEKAQAFKPGRMPDIMSKTFIAPSKPIQRAHETRTMKLRLRVREGEMPQLPSAGAQRVTMGADGSSAEVVVDIDQPQAATAEEIANAGFLAVSPMVDWKDPLIEKLAPRAIREVKDGSTMEKVDAMRQYVFRHINVKGLDQAFASGSETARTKRGDCSEHAVLLCTLLRANGVPARVACGLVYADQFAGHADIYGWHMWTQALVDGTWIDVDATLGQRYHAAHILTGVSAMNSGIVDDSLGTLIALMGNMDVEVLEVGYEKPAPGAGQ